jgi:hypothetical protein
MRIIIGGMRGRAPCYPTIPAPAARPERSRGVKRRDLLKGAAGLGLAGALGCAAGPRRPGLLREENARPGTADWLLRPGPSRKGLRDARLEGYASRTSVRAGEELTIQVSASAPAACTLDLFRLGWYGGAGGRRVARYGPFDVRPQPDPPVETDRVRACRWPPSLAIRIAEDWPSGVYLGKLQAGLADERAESYVIFVVRDDRACDLLVQASDSTWAAYNRWPDVWSLYDNGGPADRWYTGPGVGVSWDRPYAKYRQIFDAPLSQGSGEFLLWEFPLVFWLEREGYDASYISTLDTHHDAAGLRRAKAFVSVGHDEYWSRPMFDHVQAAVAAGVNAAFFSGNAVDGLIRISGRAFSRVGKFGPFEHELKAHAGWTEHGPNPALLMGARTTHPYNGSAGWTCAAEKHWLFEGTGLRNGDSIPGLVGWEHHGLPAPIPGLEVLARGPVFSGKKAQGVEYTSTLHPGPKNNLVFNAATIWWSDGLSAPPGYLKPSAHGGAPPGPDPRVQRMTSNLFARFLA